ncbi:MAG: 2-oxoacid:acceptor oxidoreductase family protein [Candidatus Omnitrophica bacterium]|nr:2-oxoacid:acceptor oxidoreductase family protein [Candidatus Omnitrophota bacterium]MCM8771186.1 2-oxoacid:acceptor oxidoreductase family protein [Candidatus Omnitrophota bacterium]
MMKEIRIHARAGQGAITTANLLGYAYFLEGKYAYAFPHFGAARMGAPMNAFVRVDAEPIRLRSQIYEPDYVLIVDNTLLRGFNCFAGLKDKGIAIINAEVGFEAPKVKPSQKVFVIPANAIAEETIGRPLGNTALIGAFAAVSGELKLETLIEAVRQIFSGKAEEGNIAALKRGYAFIKKV